MSGDQTGHCLDTLVIWNKYFFLCKKLCAQHSFCSLQYVYAILVTAWQGSMERKHRNQQKCVQTSSKWCPWTTLGASAWLSQGMVLRFLLRHQQRALFRLVVTCDKWESIQTDISCFENEIRFKLPGWIAWCITVIAIILMISSGLPQTNRYCRMISMIFLAPIKKMQPFCLHLFLISIAVGSCFSIFLNNLIKTRNSCQFDSNSFHH